VTDAGVKQLQKALPQCRIRAEKDWLPAN